MEELSTIHPSGGRADLVFTMGWEYPQPGLQCGDAYGNILRRFLQALGLLLISLPLLKMHEVTTQLFIFAEFFGNHPEYIPVSALLRVVSTELIRLMRNK